MYTVKRLFKSLSSFVHLLFSIPRTLGLQQRFLHVPAVQEVYQGFAFENMKAPLFPVPVPVSVSNECVLAVNFL